MCHKGSAVHQRIDRVARTAVRRPSQIHRGLADPELKEIFERSFGRHPQRPENCTRPGTSADGTPNGEIEINRRTRGFKLELHGIATLQDPRSFRFEKQTRQQAVKGDLPPESLQVQPFFARAGFEAFFQRGAEGFRR
jgi:hypothetical protein